MFNLIINSGFYKKRNINFFNKKNLFFFKFLKLKNIKRRNTIGIEKISNTKLIRFFTNRLFFKKKRYKKYNYFKFSIIKYIRYINNINIYKLNNFLINYKFNLYANEIVYNIDQLNSFPILNYLNLELIDKQRNIKKKTKLKRYKFRKRRFRVRWFKKIKRKLLNLKLKKIKSRFHINNPIRAIKRFNRYLFRRMIRRKKSLRKKKYLRVKRMFILNKKKSIKRLYLITKKYIPTVKKRFIKFRKIKKLKSYQMYLKKTQLTNYNYKKNFNFLLHNQTLITNFKIFFNSYNFKTYQWRIII